MHNVLKIKMVNFQIIKNTMENIPCDEGKGGSQFDSARENGEDGNQPKSDHEEDGGGDIDIDVDDRGKSDEKGGEGQFASDGFSCNECPRKFKLKFKLEKHFKAVHDEKTFKCSDCFKTFTRKNNYMTHHLNMHRKSDHVCVTCGRKFRTDGALHKHLEFGKYCLLKCVSCTRTFKRKNDVEKHEKKCNYAEDTGGVCGLCLKSFQSSWKLETHRKYTTKSDGSFRFVCWQCNRYFCSSQLMRDHDEKDHAGPESLQILKKVFNDRRDGVKGSFPDDGFPCEKCGKSFASQETMMTHLKSHHVKANTRTSFKRQLAMVTENLQCKICHTKFSLWKNYKRHKNGVYDAEKHPLNLCEICGKICCTTKLLRGHLKLAHEDLSCQVCEKKFTTKRNLERHLKQANCMHNRKTN